MSISNVKHNKIKNTAILYELLSRQITVDVLNDTKNSPAVKIFKEFFNKNTEMGKEYELYRILSEKKYSKESHAVKLIEAVVTNRQRLSNRRLNNEKYNLIKTIKENYNVKDFSIHDYQTLKYLLQYIKCSVYQKIQILLKLQIVQSH